MDSHQCILNCSLIHCRYLTKIQVHCYANHIKAGTIELARIVLWIWDPCMRINGRMHKEILTTYLMWNCVKSRHRIFKKLHLAQCLNSWVKKNNNATEVLPSSSCERNRNAETSAYVTPPRKKISVVFCWSALLECVELPDPSRTKPVTPRDSLLH